MEEYTGNGFGQFLKSYRKEKKMTRADLSDILDVSESYLGLLERGERKPSYTLLIKVVKTLHVSADEVIGIDSYVGRQVYISELVKKMDTLDDKHRLFLVKMMELLIHLYGNAE